MRAGDVLIADGGFTCVREGERLTVCDDGSEASDATDRLYFACSGAEEDSDDRSERHYLNGQVRDEIDDDTLIGLSRA